MSNAVVRPLRLLVIPPIIFLAMCFDNEMVGLIFAFALATLTSFLFPAVERLDKPEDKPEDKSE